MINKKRSSGRSWFLSWYIMHEIFLFIFLFFLFYFFYCVEMCKVVIVWTPWMSILSFSFTFALMVRAALILPPFRLSAHHISLLHTLDRVFVMHLFTYETCMVLKSTWLCWQALVDMQFLFGLHVMCPIKIYGLLACILAFLRWHFRISVECSLINI